MFDNELFYGLCEQYNVELSSQYDKPMIINGNKIECLDVVDIKEIFAYPDAIFPYCFNNGILQKYDDIYNFDEVNPLVEAC